MSTSEERQRVLEMEEDEAKISEWEKNKEIENRQRKKEEVENNIRLRLNILTFLTLLSVVLGTVIGYSFKTSESVGSMITVNELSRENTLWNLWTARKIQYLELPGELFLNMLACMSLPLCLSSIIAAIGSINIRAFGSIIWRCLVFTLLSTLVASGLGVLVATVLRPGRPEHHPVHPICLREVNQSMQVNSSNVIQTSLCTEDGHPCNPLHYDIGLWYQQRNMLQGIKTPNKNNKNVTFCATTYTVINCEMFIDYFLDLIRSFFPRNILRAFLSLRKTRPNLRRPNNPKDKKYRSCMQYFLEPPPKESLQSFRLMDLEEPGANMIGLISFFVLLGLAGIFIGESGRPVLNLCTSLSECTLKIATWFLWVAPIGVCCALAGKIIGGTALFEFPRTIMYYMLTCVLGMLIHGFVLLPLVYFVVVRRSPFKLYRQLLPVIGISYGFSNSSGSIPVTIHILEDVCGLDPRVVRIFVPIASQISSDGNAICTVIGVIYIAQLHDVHFGIESLLLLVLVGFVACTYASSRLSQKDIKFQRRMGVALRSLALPSEFIVYIAAAEKILESSAMAINALSDCVGVAIICRMDEVRLEKEEKLLKASFERKTDVSADADPLVKANKLATKNPGKKLNKKTSSANEKSNLKNKKQHKLSMESETFSKLKLKVAKKRKPSPKLIRLKEKRLHKPSDTNLGHIIKKKSSRDLRRTSSLFNASPAPHFAASTSAFRARASNFKGEIFITELHESQRKRMSSDVMGLKKKPSGKSRDSNVSRVSPKMIRATSTGSAATRVRSERLKSDNRASVKSNIARGTSLTNNFARGTSLTNNFARGTSLTNNLARRSLRFSKGAAGAKAVAKVKKEKGEDVISSTSPSPSEPQPRLK